MDSEDFGASGTTIVARQIPCQRVEISSAQSTNTGIPVNASDPTELLSNFHMRTARFYHKVTAEEPYEATRACRVAREVRYYTMANTWAGITISLSLGAVSNQCQRRESSSQRSSGRIKNHSIILKMKCFLGQIVLEVNEASETRAFLEPSISYQWRLSFPSVVRKDSQVILSTHSGDIAGLSNMFKHREARPSDVMPDGRGLLHVRISVAPPP